MARAEILQYLGKQRPRKLFLVLNQLERFGIGRRMTRVIWKQEDASVDVGPCYWTVTRVRPEKVKRESVQVRINPILFFFFSPVFNKG